MKYRWKPNVTVAAIIESDGKFLLVEELTQDGLKLNNPAGHVDPGESLMQACSRETLEETAYHFTPTALVGVYMSRFERHEAGLEVPHDITYLRFAFCGQLGKHEAERMLDEGIVRAMWLTRDEICQRKHLHRNALLMNCIDDYLAGQRCPLDLITTDESVFRQLPALGNLLPPPPGPQAPQSGDLLRCDFGQ